MHINIQFKKSFENSLDLPDQNCYAIYIPIGKNSHYLEGQIMNKTTVMLGTINDVKSFVTVVSQCDYDVDLISGRYAVDAKSIMGIFSLDLSKPIKLEAHTDDASEFFAQIKEFIVD